MYYQLRVEKDVSVPVRDGSSLCADVFRPDESGEFPVIMTLGPYPKDIHFKDWVPGVYEHVPEQGPYMHWETVNPEWWVPQGYAVIRVDTRGTGKSHGMPRLLTTREAEDFYDAVEWAGVQEWSNGKVAVMGISYFAMNAWRVAALNPPHLAAVVPWEGALDLFRDANRHGGIRSNTFTNMWSSKVREHQQAADSEQEQVASTELYGEAVARNHPDVAKIKAPLWSEGNWGGPGLHLRGNTEGYLDAGSDFKRLQIHSGDHITPFYTLEGRLEQLRFLEHWLRGVDTGITREPPVKLAIRYGGDRYVWRYENEWPLARTRWTPYYLNASDSSLSLGQPAREASARFSAELGADNTAVTFATERFAEETEVTGPIKVKLWVSSTSDDADLFCIIHNVAADGEEVTYPGTIQPAIAAAYGWLRVSHRKLDPVRSTAYRPYHAHDELQKLEEGELVPVEIEVWPSSIVIERGHRLVLEVGSKDDPRMVPFTHTDPADRIQVGTNSIHTGGAYDSHLLLPVIPPRD